MTVRELQKEIRKAMVQLSEAYESFENAKVQEYDKLAIESFIKKKQEQYGTGKKGLLAMRFRGKKKADFQEQLLMIENLTRFINLSRNKAEKELSKFESQYKSFQKKHEKHVSADMFRGLLEVFSMLGSSLIEQFGSDQIIDLWFRYGNAFSPREFTGIIKETYENNLDNGFTAQEMFDAIELDIENAAFERVTKK